jgi:RNA recognition motif-containing protein
MREKEEREREEKRRGYVSNVDKNSMSFYVSNFPEEVNVGDLWKIFAHYGSVGDVYIPNKVDKWGKRFAFVKFKGVKKVEELPRSLEDVWSGSYKLWVNRARFDRNNQSPNEDGKFFGRQGEFSSCERPGE